MDLKEMLNSNNSGVMVVATPKMLYDFALFVADAVIKGLKIDEETLYTPREFAKRKQVDVSTLWRWCKAGILKKTVIGGKVYYKDSDLLEE